MIVDLTRSLEGLDLTKCYLYVVSFDGYNERLVGHSANVMAKFSQLDLRLRKYPRRLELIEPCERKMGLVLKREKVADLYDIGKDTYTSLRRLVIALNQDRYRLRW